MQTLRAVARRDKFPLLSRTQCTTTRQPKGKNARTKDEEKEKDRNEDKDKDNEKVKEREKENNVERDLAPSKDDTDKTRSAQPDAASAEGGKEHHSWKKDKDEDTSSKNIDSGVIRNSEDTGVIFDDKTKTLEDETKLSTQEILINSILDNLRLEIAGSQRIDLSEYTELVNIDKAEVEMPKRTETLPSEVELIEDSRGEWCVMKARIRKPKAKWSNYEDFLKTYRHVVEGGVKELFTLYHINSSDYESQIRIAPPQDIGFANDPRQMTNLNARSVVYDNPASFQILRGIGHSDSIPIVSNEFLQPLIEETQNFLINTEYAQEILVWVEDFIRRKDQFAVFGMRVLIGENNVHWVRCPHPRRISLFLSVIPNANRISIPYVLRFIGPSFSTEAVDVSNTAAALRLSQANTSVFARLATKNNIKTILSRIKKIY